MADPERTCVGCRARAPQRTLLRVVAVGGTLLPDAGRRLPGRGAYLHADPQCLERATRRRAWARALRLAAAPECGPLEAAVRGNPAAPAAVRRSGGAGQ